MSDETKLDQHQPQPEKLVIKTATVVRTPHWIEAVQKDTPDAPSDDLWAYASVEEQDSMGDIIRVAGIDYGQYHNPPNTYMKILAGHAKALANGEPPVIGRVEEFRLVKTPDGTPALAFRMSWADTPLANSYRSLYQKGYMDSFSVGASITEAEPIKGAGWDYITTMLMEISAVSVQANVRANVIRSADDDAKIITAITGVVDRLAELESKVIDSLDKRLETLSERLDAIESAIVVTAERSPRQPHDRTKGTPAEQQLSAIERQLHRLKQITSN